MPVPAVTNYTLWDIGGCNCPLCNPCPLPSGNLTATLVVASGPNAGTYAVVFTYALVGGFPTWDTGVQPLPIGTWRATAGCTPGCSYYTLLFGVVSTVSEEFPPNCTGRGFGAFPSWSTTCSPLSLVGTDGVVSLTITP